jgi:hypothetical protein
VQKGFIIAPTIRNGISHQCLICGDLMASLAMTKEWALKARLDPKYDYEEWVKHIWEMGIEEGKIQMIQAIQERKKNGMD